MSVIGADDTEFPEEEWTQRSGRQGEPATAGAQYTPYFLDGLPHVPVTGDAYVHVRLVGQRGTGGLITVYLANGTALRVPGRDLLVLVPSGSGSETRNGSV